MTIRVPHPYDRNLGFLFADGSRLLRRRFAEKAGHLELTRAQWQVLANVARSQGIHQRALADILDVEPITLARIVDKLEANGLVERRQDPADRRVRLLHLTDKAFPLLAEMREIGAAVRDEAMAGIAQADRERLIELLEKVRTNLSTIPTARSERRG